MAELAQLRIYTDGSCEFCLWARSLVEPYDSEHRLDFRDFNNPEIAAEAPFPLAQLSRRMHVLDSEGRWRSGFWGWVAILRVLPKLRWVARLLALPPFRWLGPYIYDFLAPRRFRIPRVLFRGAGTPRPCDESCALPQNATRNS